jgi:hypothetical protein
MVYFLVIWYISSRFEILYQEKNGNPAFETLASIVDYFGAKFCGRAKSILPR